jgi:hypothetical protein
VAYDSTRFEVSLEVPRHWQPVPGSESRHEGPDGFFVLDAIGVVGTNGPGATLDDVVVQQIGHKLRPFGSQPNVEVLTVQNQEARLILPSDDASMGDQAALIAVYPRPVQLGQLCQYFVLYADVAHIRDLVRTLTFHASGIVAFQAVPAEIEPGDVVTLSWAAVGNQAILCPSARYSLFTSDDCLPVPLSATTTFTIPVEARGNRGIDFLLTVDGMVAQASVAFKCPRTWFFSDQSLVGICPLEPTHTFARAQRFERGTMIWVEQIGRTVILEQESLFEEDEQRRVTYLQDPLSRVRPSPSGAVAPEGLYLPEGDFGLIWRGDVAGSPGYRETLGWALAPEYGYQAIWQCDDALPSGGRSWRTCHLLGPEGEVFVLDPLERWSVWDASDAP